jgi:hypothetical protein
VLADAIAPHGSFGVPCSASPLRASVPACQHRVNRVSSGRRGDEDPGHVRPLPTVAESRIAVPAAWRVWRCVTEPNRRTSRKLWRWLAAADAAIRRRSVPPDRSAPVPQPGRERPPSLDPRRLPVASPGVAHVPVACLDFEVNSDRVCQRRWPLIRSSTRRPSVRDPRPNPQSEPSSSDTRSRPCR